LAPPDPATFDDLTDRERAVLVALEHAAEWDSGYSREHATRPQTVGYGLVDSPAALCAWIIEKFQAWTDCDGDDLIHVPTGCSIFPKELQRPSRRWAERRFTDIRHWNELDRGGHFAAFEQPELFVDEVRTFFRHVR
jgi:pimeloyl-ACP methyl ester carboxylesterase